MLEPLSNPDPLYYSFALWHCLRAAQQAGTGSSVMTFQHMSSTVLICCVWQERQEGAVTPMFFASFLILSGSCKSCSSHYSCITQTSWRFILRNIVMLERGTVSDTKWSRSHMENNWDLLMDLINDLISCRHAVISWAIGNSKLYQT